MKSVAFFTQKGGSGKTTLAVHMAVAAQQSGERVVIVDTDYQASATAWATVRQAPTPRVVTVSPADVFRVKDMARHEGITLAILDTAPHAMPLVSHVVAASDLILIPCRPTAFDLAAMSNSVGLVTAASKPAAFVLNACPARAPEVDETREALTAYGLPIAPIHIGDRRAFSRAVASGRAVTEFEADGKAAQEITALWSWLKEQLA